MKFTHIYFWSIFTHIVTMRNCSLWERKSIHFLWCLLACLTEACYISLTNQLNTSRWSWIDTGFLEKFPGSGWVTVLTVRGQDMNWYDWPSLAPAPVSPPGSGGCIAVTELRSRSHRDWHSDNPPGTSAWTFMDEVRWWMLLLGTLDNFSLTVLITKPVNC